MRRYGPCGPIRPCGSDRSALGPPSAASWLLAVRRGRQYTDRCEADRTSRDGRREPSGRRQTREDVLEQPLAGREPDLASSPTISTADATSSVPPGGWTGPEPGRPRTRTPAWERIRRRAQTQTRPLAARVPPCAVSPGSSARLRPALTLVRGGGPRRCPGAAWRRWGGLRRVLAAWLAHCSVAGGLARCRPARAGALRTRAGQVGQNALAVPGEVA